MGDLLLKVSFTDSRRFRY